MKALTIALALVGMVTAAQADTLRSQILKGEAVYTKAMKNNDMATFEKLIQSNSTPDFKYTEDGRTMDMKKMLEMMKLGMSQMKKVTRADGELIALKESGKTAAATMRRTTEGLVMTPDKKTHVMKFTGLCTDSYVKVGGKWKMSGMVWGKTTTSIDGKVVPAGKM